MRIHYNCSVPIFFHNLGSCLVSSDHAIEIRYNYKVFGPSVHVQTPALIHVYYDVHTGVHNYIVLCLMNPVKGLSALTETGLAV